MSPEKATMANPSVVKLVPNRTDYKQWKESTLNLLAIQGLAHYTKTPGFGANLDMQTASKEKVHCANNMSKCYQIIWNTLDRSIQAQANFQQLNHEDQEKVPMKLLLLCEAFKNSKSESSLLWAKLSQPPNNIKQLVNWVDDFQYNFARYKDMNANSLEVDHILHLWSRSTQPRIRDMARVIQDEKSKEPHNIDRIVLMIKNQARTNPMIKERIQPTMAMPRNNVPTTFIATTALKNSKSNATVIQRMNAVIILPTRVQPANQNPPKRSLQTPDPQQRFCLPMQRSNQLRVTI
jgi:hypothetical protein